MESANQYFFTKRPTIEKMGAILDYGPITPNSLGLGALILLFIGLPFLHPDTLYIAVPAIGLSWFVDMADGPLARWQNKAHERTHSLLEEIELGLWKRIWLKGGTHLGEQLDPFIDKLRFHSVMILLLIENFNPVLCALEVISFGFAFSSTLMRYRFVNETAEYLREGHSEITVDVRATNAGKIKVWLELLAVSALVVGMSAWSFPMLIAACVFMVIGDFLAGISYCDQKRKVEAYRIAMNFTRLTNA